MHWQCDSVSDGTAVQRRSRMGAVSFHSDREYLLLGHEAVDRLRALAGAHDEEASRQRIQRACVPNLCGHHSVAMLRRDAQEAQLLTLVLTSDQCQR